VEETGGGERGENGREGKKGIGRVRVVESERFEVKQ